MIVESKPVESAREFMQRMNGELGRDYTFRARRYTDLCLVLAIKIGKKLLNEGNSPHIEKLIAPSTRSRQIVPLAYGGRVQWGIHCFCVSEQEAWDPVIGVPVPIESYQLRLIGETLHRETHFSPERLREDDENKIVVSFD